MQAYAKMQQPVFLYDVPVILSSLTFSVIHASTTLEVFAAAAAARTILVMCNGLAHVAHVAHHAHVAHAANIFSKIPTMLHLNCLKS